MDEGGFIQWTMTLRRELRLRTRSHLQTHRRFACRPKSKTIAPTGCSLGIAAVTEPNRVILSQAKRDQQTAPIDEITSLTSWAASRNRRKPAKIEFIRFAGHDRRPHQTPPKPIVIKLSSQDAKLLGDTAPQVAEVAIGQSSTWESSPGRGHSKRHRKHPPRPGRDVPGNSRRRASRRLHAGRNALDCRRHIGGKPEATPVFS